DLRLAFDLLETIEHAQAVHSRHPDVEEHEIESLGAELPAGFDAVLRDADVETGLRQGHARYVSRDSIIVDDEHAGRRRYLCRHGPFVPSGEYRKTRRPACDAGQFALR